MQLKKERKGKGLLYLIGIAVLISIVFIACKKKPTGINDFVFDEPTTANPSETLTPDGELSIDKNKSFQQYDGKYFESKTYKNDDGTEFKYTIEIKNLNDEHNNTILIFTGFEKGTRFSREYKQMGYKPGNGDVYGDASAYSDKYDRRLTAHNHNSAVKVAVKFYNDENNKGWVDLKPSNYNFTIKLALKNKTSN